MKKNGVTIIFGGIFLLLLLGTCCVLWTISSGGVDQIRIHIFFPPNFEPIYTKTFTDRKEINTIVEKVRIYADNWIQPTFSYFSSPQPPVQVAFAREGETELLEAFFIGDRYGFPFIAVLPGGKYLSETEFKELMAVLGIDENCARLSPANPTCNTDGFIEEEPFPSMPK